MSSCTCVPLSLFSGLLSKTHLFRSVTWAKPCIEHTYWLYQIMYFETDERLINSARKYISIQSLYSFFIAVKWLDGFTSTGIEMYFILFLTIDVFRFHRWLNTKKDPSQRNSGKLEKKCINFNSLWFIQFMRLFWLTCRQAHSFVPALTALFRRFLHREERICWRFKN